MQDIPEGDLVPGKILTGWLSGKIKLLFSDVGDHTTARLKFTVQVKMPTRTDYTVPGGTPLQKFMVTIILTAPAIELEKSDTAARDLNALMKDQGRSFSIDCTGAKVVSRAAGEKGTVDVVIELTGPCRAEMNGTERTLLATRSAATASTRRQGWDFYADDTAPMPGTKRLSKEGATPIPPTSTSTASRALRPVSSFHGKFGSLTFSTAPSKPASAAFTGKRPTAVGSPSERDRIDLCAHESAAPAPNSDPARQFLPTPSDVPSRPESIQASSSIEKSQDRPGAKSAPAPVVPKSIPSSPGFSILDMTHPDMDIDVGNDLEQLRAAEAETRNKQDIEAKRRRLSSQRETTKRVSESEQNGPNKRQRTDTADPARRSPQHQSREPLRTIDQPPQQSAPAEVDHLEKRRKAEAARRAQAEAKARREGLEREAAKQAAAKEAQDMAITMTQPFSIGTSTYTPLASLQNYSTVNIMGIIVDAGVPKGGSKDWIRNVIITDPSRRTEHNGEDTVITLFRKTRQELEGFQTGCPVLFRGAKISHFHMKLKGQLYSNASNEWVILGPRGPIKGPSTMGTTPEMTAAEYDRLKALATWWQTGSDHTVVNRDAELPETSLKKQHVLGEIEDMMFFNALVKVLFIHTNDRGGSFPKFELYVTDGTVNRNPTRNFHGIDARIHPNAVFSLSIFEMPPDGIKPNDYIFFPNLRCKNFRQEGLEITWSDAQTKKGLELGFKDKRSAKLLPDNPKCLAIEERLKQLRRAHDKNLPVEPAVSAMREYTPPPAVPPPVAETSSDIFTRYTDAIAHPSTSLAQALADPTVPNKYRIQARVRRIEAVPFKNSNGELAVTFCKHCRDYFTQGTCQSCNDKTVKHAEARWRILVFLEIDRAEKATIRQNNDFPDEVAVLLADEAADACLPQLPKLHTGPNEVERARRNISALRPRVEDLLLGPKWDGARTRPLIDWSILKHRVDMRSGESAVVWKVFGMIRKE